jgi:hypothetical protein
MDSTNLSQSQQQPSRLTYGWVGHTHRGMQPHMDLSTIRATHNDMLVYHSNKLHVVKVPVVVRDQLLEAIPVAHYTTEAATIGGLTVYPGNVQPTICRLSTYIHIYIYIN